MTYKELKMKDLKERRHSEKEHERRDRDLARKIDHLTTLNEDQLKQIQALTTRLFKVEATLSPISEAFSSVQGFNRIGLWILKFLGVMGVALGGLYAIIEFFKRLGK